MKKIFTITFFLFTNSILMAQTSTSKDAVMIKQLREASNKAIAAHDINALSAAWLDDVITIRGDGTHISGKDTAIAVWKKLFTEHPETIYIRTPVEITISTNDTLAWETGTWKALNSYSNGGNYSAMWKKINNEWKIQAELFVSLL